MGFPGIARLVDYEEHSSALPGEELRFLHGRRVHFRSRGEGRVVVFLHGMAASSFSFRDLMARVPSGFRFLTIDLNGFGFSERGSEVESYRLTRQAEVIKALLEDLAIDRVSLFGHSLGGAVAASFANRFPENVERVFLVSPVSKFDRPPWYLRNGISARALYAGIRVLLSRPERFRELMGRAFFQENILTELVAEEYRRQLLVEGLRDAFVGYGVALSQEQNLSETYSQLIPPAHLLGGEEDAIVSPDSLRELVQSIPRADLSLLPDCGHSAPEEFPDSVLKWILASSSSEEV
ncbi:MAG: alpha/beta hydrolase [Verrucomicrobiales bacterium]|nr:alpha/beta hydrolase [Verrucomicrobiales bacterium]